MSGKRKDEDEEYRHARDTSQTQREQDGKYRVKVTRPLHEYRLIERG